jgi:hypothetical protein
MSTEELERCALVYMQHYMFLDYPPDAMAVEIAFDKTMSFPKDFISIALMIAERLELVAMSYRGAAEEWGRQS